MRVLVVEDDRGTARLIDIILGKADMVGVLAELGADGIDRCIHTQFDAILLDLNLPDMNGLQVIEALREARVPTPIMVMSSDDSPETMITVLNAGADDYIVKPFNGGVMVARLRALIRRANGHIRSTFTIGKLEIDITARLARYDGVTLPLTGKEFQILELFGLRKGSVVTKDMFFEYLYKSGEQPDPKIIDVFICNLRKKLAAPSGESYIETVWGRGYVFDDPSVIAAAA